MISFKLFAGTNVGLRENNEDNFTVCPDLVRNEWIVPADYQQAVQLGPKGCVMIVADGMGGQNAGEVASAIAIDTVQKMFSPNHIPADIHGKPDAVKSFLKKVISECDSRIKKKTEEDASTYGMGSTIVIAWLIGCKLYIAWLGDSRAYSYVQGKGIARLSKDHSYVQQLVDTGAITEEEAMNHPNGNVITRSLGDTSQKAKADVAEYDIEDGQIILLCSDGLCGVCRDEEIGSIIEDGIYNLQKCKENLTIAALAAGGSDNITISLLQIFISPSHPAAPVETEEQKPNMLSMILAFIFGLCLLSALLYTGFSIISPKEEAVISSIQIWVDNDTLESKESTQYHIRVIGDNISTLDYDKNLINVNSHDSTISTKGILLLKDSTTYIKVTCRQNTSVMDSVPIVIKKKKVSSSSKKINEDPTTISSGTSTGTSGDGSNQGGDGSNQGGDGSNQGGDDSKLTSSNKSGPPQLTSNKSTQNNN